VRGDGGGLGPAAPPGAAGHTLLAVSQAAHAAPNTCVAAAAVPLTLVNAKCLLPGGLHKAVRVQSRHTSSTSTLTRSCRGREVRQHSRGQMRRPRRAPCTHTRTHTRAHASKTSGGSPGVRARILRRAAGAGTLWSGRCLACVAFAAGLSLDTSRVASSVTYACRGATTRGTAQHTAQRDISMKQGVHTVAHNSAGDHIAHTHCLVAGTALTAAHSPHAQ
jgi:hypothetical protein